MSSLEKWFPVKVVLNFVSVESSLGKTFLFYHNFIVCQLFGVLGLCVMKTNVMKSIKIIPNCAFLWGNGANLAINDNYITQLKPFYS